MKTRITEVHKNSLVVKGTDLTMHAELHDFAQMVMVMAGMTLSTQGRDLINRMLVLVCDHGLTPPSTMSVRLAASCGASVPQALSAGLACFGAHHINPIGDAYDWFGAQLAGDVSERRIIPGFGHVLHDRDPRAMALVEHAVKVLDNAPACKLALLTQQKLKKPRNLGGAIAAVCVDLRVPKDFSVGIAVLGRSLGLITHYAEQHSQKQKVICYDAGTEKFIREGH